MKRRLLPIRAGVWQSSAKSAETACSRVERKGKHVENFYPKKIRIHPLIIVGGALLSLYFAFKQEIISLETIKRNWRKAL